MGFYYLHMHSQIQFLKQVFHTYKLKGEEIIVRCPSCGDPRRPNKLKMNINVNKGIFHCWVCDLKGASIPRLLRKVNVRKAQEYAAKYGHRTTHKELSQKIEKAQLPDDFRLVMNSLYLPEAKRIWRYCQARGMTDDMIWRYRVGFSDRLKWRLILPSFDESGECNYWTARRVDADSNYKYVNAKTPRKDVVFNEIDLDWSADEITLVEGPFDLIKCMHLNATCLMGSYLSKDSALFTKLIHYPERIILALDKDAQDKQDRIAEMLMRYDKEVYYVQPPTTNEYGAIEDCDWGDLDPLQVQDKMHAKKIYTPTTRLIRKISNL